MSTDTGAGEALDFVSAQEILSENFTLEVLEALNVCVRGVAHAVAEDVYAGKEAERRQKLDDLKRSIGVPVYDEDDSEPFKPGEDHSYYGGPGYENATAEQCANLDRRFAAATSPTDTGAGDGRDYANMSSPQLLAAISELGERLEFFTTASKYNRRWAETAERERDAALASMAEKERRIRKIRALAEDYTRSMYGLLLEIREEARAALTPEAGTARSDGEEE